MLQLVRHIQSALRLDSWLDQQPVSVAPAQVLGLAHALPAVPDPGSRTV